MFYFRTKMPLNKNLAPDLKVSLVQSSWSLLGNPIVG